MANYDIVAPNRNNFLLISASALFILLLLIVIYYIYEFTASDPSSSSNFFQTNDKSQQQQVQSNKQSPSAVLTSSSLNSNAGSVSSGRNIPPLPTQSSIPIGYKNTGVSQQPEVFNVSENIYAYTDAEAVCKAFGADLATYEQIVAASQNGANWCNYGWSAEQRVLYPVQKSIWKKMQGNYGGNKGSCGVNWPSQFNNVNYGVQGGFQPNQNMQFGVNCYGIKQGPRAKESVKTILMSDSDIALSNKISQIQSNMENITLLPFNQNDWSGCSTTTS